jgi:hypothetical protein
MNTLATRKLVAHRAFKMAKETLVDITTKWREATGPDKPRLYAERPQTPQPIPRYPLDLPALMRRLRRSLNFNVYQRDHDRT